MSFAGTNYLAVVVAAIAAWLVGAVWYSVLSAPWIAAQGKTIEQCRAEQAAKKGTPAFYAPFVLSFAAELIMAWMTAGLVGHFGPGQVTLKNGVVSGAFIWFGFVLTTLAVNNAFAGRKTTLTVIDAGHWLAALLVIGAVIGAFGV